MYILYIRFLTYQALISTKPTQEKQAPIKRANNSFVPSLYRRGSPIKNASSWLREARAVNAVSQTPADRGALRQKQRP